MELNQPKTNFPSSISHPNQEDHHLKAFEFLEFQINQDQIKIAEVQKNGEKLIIKQLKLSEGKDFGFFSRKEILSMSSAIAPYDSFALWLHINQDRLICNG